MLKVVQDTVGLGVELADAATGRIRVGVASDGARGR